MARSTKGLYKRGNVWWMTYVENRRAHSSLNPAGRATSSKRAIS